MPTASPPPPPPFFFFFFTKQVWFLKWTIFSVINSQAWTIRDGCVCVCGIYLFGGGVVIVPVYFIGLCQFI